jgi:osmoprotectant transport system ATP-binding protein
VIRLEGVSKSYGDKPAVIDLSVEIADGEVCVLIGPSGCGKTTTLRMINRLVEPTTGRILVDGRDTSTVPREQLRRGLGYAIQSVGLFPHLDVSENIMVVPRLLEWDKARMAARVAELLDLVGLPADAYAGKFPRELSGGEAQRVGVARALAADPPVLLMDEPFGAVDPLTRGRLQTEFARIQRGLRKTVVFVTHDVDEAIRLADRIAVMRDGRLQQYATPEEILDRPANKFVHDFMGADRALKRLGRRHVSEAMRADVPRLAEGAGLAPEAARELCENSRFAYVVDSGGVLQGWLDCRAMANGMSEEEASTAVDWREGAVAPETTLRDALSIMLGMGARAVPVVDAQGVLLGEVALPGIEDVIAESTSKEVTS